MVNMLNLWIPQTTKLRTGWPQELATCCTCHRGPLCTCSADSASRLRAEPGALDAAPTAPGAALLLRRLDVTLRASRLAVPTRPLLPPPPREEMPVASATVAAYRKEAVQNRAGWIASGQPSWRQPSVGLALERCKTVRDTRRQCHRGKVWRRRGVGGRNRRVPRRQVRLGRQAAGERRGPLDALQHWHWRRSAQILRCSASLCSHDRWILPWWTSRVQHSGMNG